VAAGGKTILIVEDDRDLRRLYRTALLAAGYEVKEASDGLSALRAIDSNAPDLVVLDLALPMLNGHVVREQIQSQAHTRHIPIVIVTGSDQDLSHMRVEHVLKKPASPERLVSTVRGCLHH
jgi:two-component system, HptB-dependent secretion and biofilm response regulator